MAASRIVLMYITNSTSIAKQADAAGIDRIFVDLERLGKQSRQAGRNTVQSQHSIEDVRAIRKTIRRAKLLVRINPPHHGTAREVDAVIDGGADVVMLPFFTTTAEAEQFSDRVGGRAKVCLLCETPQAIDLLDELARIPGVDEIHIGLNDLHIAYGLRFMFELYTNGVVERAAETLREAAMPFGIGGVAAIGQGQIPAELVISEQVRLGSTRTILSRSFFQARAIEDPRHVYTTFKTGIETIRHVEDDARAAGSGLHDMSRNRMARAVASASALMRPDNTMSATEIAGSRQEAIPPKPGLEE